MAETDFLAPREGGFRSSRAPGFVTGTASRATGTISPLSNIQSDPAADQQAIARTGLDVPQMPQNEMLGDLGSAAAKMGGEYVGRNVGSVAGTNILGETVGGATVGGGATIGEGISQGFSSMGDQVSGMFGGGATESLSAIPPSSFGEGGAGFASGVGEAGSGISEAGSLAEGAGSIGDGATALGGAGEAGSTLGESFSSGANIGGGIGAGVFRAGIGLAMGEKPAQALRAGVASGAGYYVGAAIGSAMFGPVGTVVGGFLGSTVGSIVGGGGRVICTELHAQGKLDATIFKADVEFSAGISPIVRRGYHAWAVPFVRLMRRSKTATSIVAPFARWRAEELAYRMGVLKTPCWKGKAVRFIGEPICFIIGLFVEETDWRVLNSDAQTA
jgi:hypothetical protein